MEQLGEGADLKQDQLFDKNVMGQDHAFQKGEMALEMAHLKASHSVANARTKVMGAIQGLPESFINLLLSTAAQMDALAEARGSQKLLRATATARPNGAFFGEDFLAGPTPEQQAGDQCLW